MATSPGAYRRHRRHFNNGDHGWVLQHSADTMASLGPDASLGRWGPGIIVRYGACLARRQHLVAADLELTTGLTAAPGSLAAGDLSPLSHWVLQLAEVTHQQGHIGRSVHLARQLWDGPYEVVVRTGAARALAAANLHHGDVASAHRWLDQASAVAGSAYGTLYQSLVHADRALVIAADGRMDQAIEMTFEGIERLDAYNNHLARAQAAVTAAVVSLAAAHHGDLWSARHLHSEAVRHHHLTHRPITDALIDLSWSAVMRLDGQLEAAEAPAERAARTLATAGAEPARAVAVREQSLVAAARGQWSSAVALADHAAQMFASLAMPLEQARTRSLLDELHRPGRHQAAEGLSS